jgi:hypothetical protein
VPRLSVSTLSLHIGKSIVLLVAFCTFNHAQILRHKERKSEDQNLKTHQSNHDNKTKVLQVINANIREIEREIHHLEEERA